MIRYALLFLWCFLAASIVPVSSEFYFVGLLAQDRLLVLAVSLATLGNTLGGLTTFWLGWKGGELALKNLSEKNRKRMDWASKVVHRYGAFALILSWIPFLGDVVVTLGGVLKLPVLPSIFWMTLGKLGRYLLLGLSTLGLLS